MDDKTPKSPILVLATILFLASFIVLPPVLRKYMPKEEKKEEIVIAKHKLFCEKIAVKDKKKITSEVFYENNIAVKNIMTFMDYTPSADEKDEVSGSMTVEQEILYLKSILGVDIEENASQVVITLTQQNVADNPTEIEVLNYVGTTEVVTKYFEENGFSCAKSEN